MDTLNHGILYSPPKPSDYRFGSATSAPIKRTVIDWDLYLPDYEPQTTFDPKTLTGTDYMDCTTFSEAHMIETQINWNIQRGWYLPEALQYFEDAGYMENGKFRISVRYDAVMNKTTTAGQYMDVAADGYRNPSLNNNPKTGYGLLPNKDLPMLPKMTWVDYYAPISQESQDKAKKIYDYIDISWNWVDPWNIEEALLNAPVAIATAVCAGWNTDDPINACGGPIQHCTMVYGINGGKYQIRDQYDPFNKELSSNYHIFAAIQIVVGSKMPPTAFQKLLNLFKTGKLS